MSAAQPTATADLNATVLLPSRALTPERAATLALVALIVLAAVLRFANLEVIGQGNTYYTAAVAGMLQSPANFFFAAAEPGGSVTVDKPPVGLWLQAISASIFGVNGFAVALPQILAGIACVPLIYLLVRRHFGIGAGVAAAFIMAVMPIDIATARNNTMDMTLVFTLLLAAWAFIRATETGKLGWLVMGGVLVGVGFNIKMLQAFLPVPAFFALYFLGARVGWLRKIVHLAIASVVLVAVSLSWALAVDSIPADQRPYVGSSSSNSVIELMLGYNGINRLTGGNGPTGNAVTQPLPTGGAAPGGAAGGAVGGLPGGQSGPFGGETGSPGALRLFTGELGAEAGWLLPAALISLGALLLSVRLRLPLALRHQGSVLWGGWLLTVVVFFSAAEFFHAYYLVMLTPAVAALVGGGLSLAAGARLLRPRLTAVVLLGAALGVVVYQVWLASGYLGDLATGWVLLLVAPFGALAAALMLGLLMPRGRGAAAAITLAAAALLIIPTAWGAATTADPNASASLPHAWNGTDTGDFMGGGPGGGAVDEELLAYLQANTEGMRYMVAVQSSMIGAPYVLETGRGVLYMGGFSGGDPVVDADGLAALVEAGELRYVLSSGFGGAAMRMLGSIIGGGSMPPMPGGGGGPMMMNGQEDGISDWLAEACTPVEGLTLAMDGASMPMPITGNTNGLPAFPGNGGNGGGLPNFPGGLPGMTSTLYDCAPGG